ncbi:MAG: hypothetical protein MJ066_01140 [Clostridia bacterium]|nr:hypothetical protein [Clostridia bacterium]
MIYTLKNEKIEIKVNSLGAEIISVIKDGKERMWQNENGEWDGHAPVLFPYCGTVVVTKFGKDYIGEQHGLACYIGFALIEQGKDFLRFSACSSKETKKTFPYDFILEVIYRLKEDNIIIEYNIGNPSDENLYYACGGHESFKIEDDIENYYLEFEKEEDFIDHEVNNDTGHLSGITKSMGKGRILKFSENKLINDRTIVLKDINSRKVMLKKNDGTLIGESNFNGINNVLFWRPGLGKTVCIEPWTNLPDTDNAPSIEFSQKYGVFELEPKKTANFVRLVKYY